MSTSGYAEGEIVFTPRIQVPADSPHHPDNPARGWARFVLDEDGTASRIRPVVPEEGAHGVSDIAFEIDDFATGHPQLAFSGHLEYSDDSGHEGDCWRITVLPRKGRNCVYLTRKDRRGQWPDPAERGKRMRDGQWPKGW